jgi:hypothetical protein
MFSAAGGAALAGALHKRRDCNTPDPRGRLLTKRTTPGPCGRPGAREALTRPAHHARVLPAGSLVTPGGTPRTPGVTSGAPAAGHQGKDRRDTPLPMRAGHRRSQPAGRSPQPVRSPRARALVGQAHPGDPGQLTDIPLPASVSRRRPPPHPGVGAFAHAPAVAAPGRPWRGRRERRGLVLADAVSERWKHFGYDGGAWSCGPCPEPAVTQIGLSAQEAPAQPALPRCGCAGLVAGVPPASAASPLALLADWPAGVGIGS